MDDKKKQIETPEERAKRKRERDLADIRKVISTPEGRRFYWQVLSESGLFREPFDRDCNDQTNYNLGRMAVGRVFYYDLIAAKPEALQQIQREIDSELTSEKIIDEKARKTKGILDTSARPSL